MDKAVTDLGPDEIRRLRGEVARLNKVVRALMDRAERNASVEHSEFSLFQTAVMLEEQVRNRTRALETAQQQMTVEISQRRATQAALEREKEEQRQLILKLEEAHHQLLQSEKLASIGQLAAGVAHEINNPIGFVNSNLSSLRLYIDQLLQLCDLYQRGESLIDPDAPLLQELQRLKSAIDLPFLREDIRALLEESVEGTARVRRIVQDLRDFSRVGDIEWQQADIHTGLESTLNIAANEIKYRAEVVRDYGELPPIDCVPAQLNQVFLNLLVNAAQAMSQRGTITIRTRRHGAEVRIAFVDTGSGIAPELLDKVFDPFFTTKPVGSGTGLGLSLSYGIIQKHGGRIAVESAPGEGTCFTLHLPISRPAEASPAG